MSAKTTQDRLISHATSPESIDAIVAKAGKRIQQQGDKPGFTVAEQLELLHQLTQFDFGRYILQNQGVNGYWTHYMVMHPHFGRKTGTNNRGEAFTELESFLLNKLPIMLATQQRMDVFLNENQLAVKNGAKLACIPCGMMGELLYLDLSLINDIELIGIDYDADTFNDARLLAEQQGLSSHIKFRQEDAWQLTARDEFDLISSSGLTLYEPDDDRVTALYGEFYKALKSGGKLVTSFVTYPPTQTDQCEWDFSHVNQQDVLRQKTLFVDIIQMNCQYCRSSSQTKAQLEAVGFVDIKFIYDDAKIFPTVWRIKNFSSRVMEYFYSYTMEDSQALGLSLNA